MSKVIIYQCDMCHNRTEYENFLLKCKVPIRKFGENDNVGSLEYKEYDLCEDCGLKVSNFINNFVSAEDQNNNDVCYLWFVETTFSKDPKDGKWYRENGPFLTKEEAEKKLDISKKVNSLYKYRLTHKVVPAWVKDFLNYDTYKR